MLLNYVSLAIVQCLYRKPPLYFVPLSKCTLKQQVRSWRGDFGAVFTARRGTCDIMAPGWLIILAIALTALHWLAFDLIGWEITSTAERMIGGGNGMLLIYCPIITGLSRRTGTGGGGGLQKDRERGTERGREGLINKGGEWMREREGLKIVEENGEPRIATLILMFYFIWGGRCAGVRNLALFRSGPFPLAVWLTWR